MNSDDLKAILDQHAKWLANERDGKRAYLCGADLRGAYLYGANLYGANLRGANLSGANLSGAYLYGANLRDADLSGADLSEANLSGANLYGADLSGANLREANLSWADLSWANLRGANLSEANLSRADLSWANLYGADLSGAIGVATREACIARLDQIREHVCEHGDRLEMSTWHGDAWTPDTPPEHACGTAHCLAGWAQALCPDPTVRKLDPVTAGVRLIPLAAPHFWDSNEAAKQWLENREYAKEP